MSRAVTVVLLILAALVVPTGTAAADPLSWRLTETGTDAQLRGLSAVSRHVAWASGSGGTVLRTVDGGRTWTDVGPPGADALDFRDIEAFDARTAVALSIGTGASSRVYRTTDGGATWTETFRNTEEAAFYNCAAFFDRRHGLVVGDPVDGEFRVLSTSDGGRSWRMVPGDGIPDALPGEYQFSASGQCVTVAGREHAWIATGGSDAARVLHSADRGRTWTASDTPLASGESAGVFAVAFRDPRQGVAIGGDYLDPTAGTDNLALTRDGGDTWREPGNSPAGYRSAVTYHPFLPSALIAVGPTGSDLSLDGGRHWWPFDDGSFDSVDCGRDGACWASGEQGRVGTLRIG
ncbi:WD40/YVTN/BNR-like repeat-containing protein [Actinophytocola gossypii]|uniref:Oxidoreductase n=1 Tax=Actinophytocola gossypii TaxID=2812003 RepID=A0ABT2J8I8_9PSEU|nr:oxidoreductase [Actinophytocola gossypii]MCT2584168.1 oxidoreductase [Actinophytocola gossypii]